MRVTLKTRIWVTIIIIVLLFSFFILFYFPAQQEKYLLKDFNKEVQNLAGTVALGVKIALTEQNFEGVQTAMDFVKDDPHMKFVSMLQVDTVRDEKGGLKIERTVFKTYPENVKVNPNITTSDSIIVKLAPFQTKVLNGEILLGFSTVDIQKSKQQIRLTSIVVSAIVFLIGIILGFWLAKRISVPLLALRDAALLVGEGDRNQHVYTKTRDEIDDLSKAFNKMVSDLKLAEEKILAAQNQLIHSEKMASLGQMTAGIAHEIQNPLNFVNNFSQLSKELIGEFNSADNEEEKLEILSDIKSNLEKINHHGKRADSIVKGMLMHSRNNIEEKQLTDLNALCDETMNLSFHSMRSTVPNFNCEIEKNFPTDVPKANIILQDISRVILNLLNNAFYIVHEKSEGNKDDIKNFTPKVSISTSYKNGFIRISIRDNGNGIPDSIKEKIFEPFFTTKPTGEGTGLGLSISYDIVKAHNGTMKLETKSGEFTVFIITLPA